MPSPARSNLGLLVVGLGTVVAPLDTAVNIAFPSITRAFALAIEDIRWVVIAYVLTYASLMLVFGRLGDLLGYRRIFQLYQEWKTSPVRMMENSFDNAHFSFVHKSSFGQQDQRKPVEYVALSRSRGLVHRASELFRQLKLLLHPRP